VAGFANGMEHFWCETADGEVVDPTVGQFEGLAVEYRPFEPGDEVRVGKCMNCGEPIYASVERLDDPRHHRTFCDENCQRSFCAAEFGE
jgi:formylmethanofuran dehydrogenase subunit E